MRVFDTRREMVRHLGPTDGVIAEFGVDEGEFSEFMWRALKPSRIYLVDAWDDEGEEAMHGTVVQRFRGVETVSIYKQSPVDFLNKTPKASFDMVYMDAAYPYEAVMTIMQNAWPRLIPGGWLMGHDFDVKPPESWTDYGFRAFLGKHVDAHLEAVANDGRTAYSMSFAIRKRTGSH